MRDYQYIKTVSQRWKDSYDKNAVIKEYNIKPLMGTNGIRLSVRHNLRSKVTKYVPVLSESNELQFAYGWPHINVLTVEQVINEERQYRVIATTKDGEEHYSDWYDKEENAIEIQNKVNQEDNIYIDSMIQKKIKELEDEPDEDLPEINLNLKQKPESESKKK